MILGIILLVFLMLCGICYFLFFKEYSLVMGNFETLLKVIEARDLILMRLLPEIKSKDVKEKMTKLVSERMNAKKLGNDKLIETDVEINKNLDQVYSELNKTKNPIVKEELRRAVNLEQKLKVIRREYNKAVEAYNQKLVKHPKSMIKFWRMKPLNTYSIK